MMIWTAADPAPNPRRVRMFLKAKGLTIPETEVSLLKGEHKSAAVLALNPRGQVPFLVLDDGAVIAETVSICRYLDEVHPEPPLFGETPLERAHVDMWIRRAENVLGVPVGLFWQHGHPFTARLVVQIPAMAEQARGRAVDAMAWFDGELQGRDWLLGDRASMADIVLLSMIDFAGWIGLGVAEGLGGLRGWHQRASARFG